jgi:hypothetical protein
MRGVVFLLLGLRGTFVVGHATRLTTSVPVRSQHATQWSAVEHASLLRLRGSPPVSLFVVRHGTR